MSDGTKSLDSDIHISQGIELYYTKVAAFSAEYRGVGCSLYIPQGESDVNTVSVM